VIAGRLVWSGSLLALSGLGIGHGADFTSQAPSGRQKTHSRALSFGLLEAGTGTASTAIDGNSNCESAIQAILQKPAASLPKLRSKCVTPAQPLRTPDYIVSKALCCLRRINTQPQRKEATDVFFSKLSNCFTLVSSAHVICRALAANEMIPHHGPHLISCHIPALISGGHAEITSMRGEFARQRSLSFQTPRNGGERHARPSEMQVSIGERGGVSSERLRLYRLETILLHTAVHRTCNSKGASKFLFNLAVCPSKTSSHLHTTIRAPHTNTTTSEIPHLTQPDKHTPSTYPNYSCTKPSRLRIPRPPHRHTTKQPYNTNKYSDPIA
jgi:hypothetical protein